MLDQADPAIHMLGLPKTHPRDRANWFVFAIVVGAFVALALVVFGNLIF